MDDEPAIRLLCRVNLELEGIEVVEASSLAQARAVLEELHPSAVLLDLRLGSESGRDLLDELSGCDPPVPAVLVTGVAGADREETAGAAAVLVKPFTIDELVETVRTLTGVEERAR